MLSYCALQDLENSARVDHRPLFEASYSEGYSRELKKIGGLICSDRGGLTPLQKSKILTITVVALSAITTIAAIFCAYHFRRDYIQYLLLASVPTTVIASTYIPSQFSKIDLDRPCVRQREIEHLASSNHTVIEAIERYGSADRIIGYGLYEKLQNPEIKYRLTNGYESLEVTYKESLNKANALYEAAVAEIKSSTNLDKGIGFLTQLQGVGMIMDSGGRKSRYNSSILSLFALCVGAYLWTDGAAQVRDARYRHDTICAPAKLALTRAKIKIKNDFQQIVQNGLNHWQRVSSVEPSAPSEPPPPYTPTK